MRKIIIILIITLTTFMGGNIYTNNTGNLSENNTIISEDYPIINENFNDNFQKLEENIEDKNQPEVSNDKENEEIVPEGNNVTVTLPITLDNATEEKREEKITKEEKRIEEPKEEIIEVVQPKEEPKVVETKPEPIQEPEPVVPKCDGSNHGVGVGNSNKWFNSKQEAVNYFDGIQKTWGDKWEKNEIDSATYDKNCPYGYEVWTCPFCGKWTINFYYR